VLGLQHTSVIDFAVDSCGGSLQACDGLGRPEMCRALSQGC
jgi:hypothetical protein